MKFFAKYYVFTVDLFYPTTNKYQKACYTSKLSRRKLTFLIKTIDFSSRGRSRASEEIEKRLCGPAAFAGSLAACGENKKKLRERYLALNYKAQPRRSAKAPALIY